jgi:hypothetical protein
MAVSKRLRYEVMLRDNHRCKYCGAAAPDAALTIDHVVPQALGGSDEPGNLVTACRDCNAGKSSVGPSASLVSDVSSDALRWAAAMRQAAELDRRDAAERQDHRDAFAEIWDGYTYGGLMNKHVPLPPDFGATVDRFLDAGLDMADLRESAAIAMGNESVGIATKFRYFCGVCWQTLEQRQKKAIELLANIDDPRHDSFSEVAGTFPSIADKGAF